MNPSRPPTVDNTTRFSELHFVSHILPPAKRELTNPTHTIVQNVVADVLSRNPVDNVEGSQISCTALRALALNSREQLIREQREDPELGHTYRYLENPDDGSVNELYARVGPRILN
ncbi:hypothetical protein TNCV_4373751 [Trichonephila clavipes]|uniref:Uncharacterized protein n=1 Tax=Trichonephila clavipes TaxID=2585209 RepID=A0A8X6R5G8_TRICX|nr:hypothetical protein TNCV_4373751 [Trichonephila clavipes]